MTEDRLIEMLGRDGSGDAARGPSCPGDAELASYLDGVLERDESRHIESHLAECRRCRSAAAAVVRVQAEVETLESAPDLLLARAEKLIRSNPKRKFRGAAAWAAAATVVLALGLVAIMRSPVTDRAGESMNPTTRQSRFIEHPPIVPKISLPAEDALVSARGLSVHWTDVPGTRYYELRIVDDDGDVVLKERVTGTVWSPTADLALKPGADYFVRVDAYLDDAKPISSEHVMFQVAP